MLIVAYIIAVFYVLFIKKTEKYTWVLAASILAFLSVTSSDYADLVNYIPLFEYVNYVDFPIAIQTTGIGWTCLNKLFYMIGLNYRGLVLLMLYVNYFIMHVAVKRLKANENLYFGLFLIFPAVIQLVQFKFFTGFCIVLLGYSLLLTSEQLPIVKYIALVVLASTIHTSCLVFLVLLLVKRKHYNRRIFIIIAALLAIIMLIFMNHIVRIASLFLNSRMVNRYLIDSITPSSLAWIIAIFSVWLISFIISKYLLSNKAFKYSANKIAQTEGRVTDYCGMSIEILLITLPFLILDRNFHRFLEMGYSLLFVITGWYIAPPRYSRDKLIFIFIFMVLLSLISFLYSPYSTVLRPIFTFDGFVNLRR